MEMILTGIENKNEYYTNHYFTSIFQDNAEDTIKKWKQKEKDEEIQLPWKRLRDVRTQYYNIRDRYLRSKNEEVSKPMIQELATLYLKALGYESINSVSEEVADGLNVPIFHEVTKANGAPLLWAFLSVAAERDDDILQGYIFEKSDDEDENGASVDISNDEILAKLFFAGEEAPRFILLFGINQIALIDRNKWNEKRYLQFMMEDIYSRHEESTFMAMTVLLHKESLCPVDGASVLDALDENSHKHSAGVSDALKYALRESIEILGNEVIYDMKTRQGINLDGNPVDASELTLECLRYMYRFLFMLFIEARPELGYAPMKSQTYVQGYSLEGLRDVCDQVKEDSEVLSEGYYIDDTLKKLFHMTYFGYPENLEKYKKAIEKTSMHDAFTIEALKAHIFDPEFTKLITKARLRNCAMLQIVDLMSISRPRNSKERRGRISYSALGINQMGAVYEALLSYRGFIAEEDLYEVKRAGDKFNELDVGYFVKENELVNYDEKTERVRYESGEKKGQLRMYEKGTFIYRLAGREREKSASYYTPEVLTKCLVKYALKELLKDKTADEILHLTVCEPAMGSAAFLNETINQLAEAYLTKKQEELGETISYDKRFEELQKVKMFIADRNVYGCDLNPIAVELAEVSLWLNTIYKGAYVPWFGTQLVNGNSLIGARRQVYSQSALEAGKWYDNAPRRIMPSETRTKDRQQTRTKEIYHFLLGDPGMANYSDKVIKALEPEKIKFINSWRKEFTKKYDENDIKTLLSLSERIDDLWKKTVELRKKVEEATFEPLSIYGYEDVAEGTHLTTREKDAIYKELFKSEHMNNAGPYARLKAAMDYWCSLWFWPIEKAELLPDRQTFFFEMSLLLEGTIGSVSTNTTGQLSFVDSQGNASYDDAGRINLVTEGSQIALEFQAQYATLGRVNLDELRKRHERLNIANQVAMEQKFNHWELEFADVFAERGGFDCIIGNPPWLKTSWNEQAVLGDKNPILSVKKLSASQVADNRENILKNKDIYSLYLSEYVGVTGTQNVLNTEMLYSSLKGQQTNLYKCFLPLAWEIGNSDSISAFVHPNGIFDDPNGGRLRRILYPKLRKHFQFTNELKLFDEVHHNTNFSLNVYSNSPGEFFEVISNLLDPSTIEECYSDKLGDADVPGLKNNEGNWELRGHKNRIIGVSKEELKIFARVFDGNDLWMEARLPIIHLNEYISVLKCFANYNMQIKALGTNIVCSEMWHEANDQKKKIIRREVHIPDSLESAIYSGPHIGLANPFNKSSRVKCELNSDYDTVDLSIIPEDYLPRVNYDIANKKDFSTAIIDTNWGNKFNQNYMICSRKMLNLTSERSLYTSILPPGTSYINGIFGMVVKSDVAIIAGAMASLPYDYYMRVTGKSNAHFDTFSSFPLMTESRFADDIRIRALLLNCLSSNYSSLWEEEYRDSYRECEWGKESELLPKDTFSDISQQWNSNTPIRNDYQRRQALLELDVLVAMELGMTLEQLKTIYKVQFPVMQMYEQDTWYDQEGKIVYTNSRSINGIGCSKEEWNSHVRIETMPVEIENKAGYLGDEEVLFKKLYIPPFFKCNRLSDYEEAWHHFEKRLV
ncbi:Eco57I restriction-modification methylase domain-containing protein [Lacrimispora amygdalina]|uniref:Eco57I restriction-modification methylase domain-containing protein n=1 Tax=Lacrimispora amygdalina TaxID=253257 RepID=UPI001FA84A18|nr:class I SAM-dependent DNA methyltransferase [Lacrimispora amygdalina]